MHCIPSSTHRLRRRRADNTTPALTTCLAILFFDLCRIMTGADFTSIVLIRGRDIDLPIMIHISDTFFSTYQMIIPLSVPITCSTRRVYAHRCKLMKKSVYICDWEHINDPQASLTAITQTRHQMGCSEPTRYYYRWTIMSAKYVTPMAQARGGIAELRNFGKRPLMYSLCASFRFNFLHA